MGARKLVLIRINELPDRTLGRLLAFDESVELGRWWSMELPWVDNARMVSCIPEGHYKITPESNAHLGWYLRVHDVPNRDGILLHAANYPTQIKGCIAGAMILNDINGDRIPDASRSREAMNEMQVWFKKEAILVVVNAF